MFCFSNRRALTALVAAILGCMVSPAKAQIQGVPSSSSQFLGTTVQVNGTDSVITGGTQRGRNLFHAFSQFDLSGGSATFDGVGTSGVQGIYGRIHQSGQSTLNGLIRLQNWSGSNPELMLMNPFGFVVGSDFASSGLSSFSLLATDAMLFENSAGQVFAFDMAITSSGLNVSDPNWVDADFVGAITDSSYPDGQGGAPITVNGTMSVDELGLIGSQLDINGALESNKLRLFSQSYIGGFYVSPSSAFGEGYQSGYLDQLNYAFIPYTTASEVGGVAPQSGWVSTQAELTNSNGFGSCSTSNCPGMIRFASSSSIQPSSGSSEGTLMMAGKQTVIESSSGTGNPLSSASLIQFTSYLGGGLYSDVITIRPTTSTPATTTTTTTITKQNTNQITLTDIEKTVQTAPLTAATDAGITATTETTMSQGETALVTASIDGSNPSGSSESSTTSTTTQATTTSTQAQTLSSSEASASLQSAETAKTEKVSAALGLQGIAEDSKPLTTADVKGFLRAAIADVRSAQGDVSSGFVRANYNPAVLHLRYLTAAEAASTQGNQVTLELILITADGEPKGLRVLLNKQDFARSLRELYAGLSTQQPINVADPNSPARKLYQQLFADLDPVLRERAVSTLLLSADQGLQAVPYAALHDGEQFVGERFGLALTPSLTLTPLGEPRVVGGAILALGASRFEGLAPLPLVPEELQGVVSGQPSEVLLNQSFTPDSLLNSAAQPQYRRVHVATHAEFLPGGPAESRLYTGTGPLSLQAFRGLRDRRPGASLDLISLSACRTALGDPDSELGFAGLALQAGARSAIGSLWYVDDVATSAFFVQVYRYLDAGIPKAEALQLTRQAFSRGLIRLDGDVIRGAGNQVLISGLDASQRNLASSGLKHPYFWGGIQLLGSPW